MRPKSRRAWAVYRANGTVSLGSILYQDPAPLHIFRREREAKLYCVQEYGEFIRPVLITPLEPKSENKGGEA